MRERGAATVMALGVISVLFLVATGLVAIGRLVAGHVQATTAADAASLAAAPLTFLPGDPRAEAAEFAAANGAHLVACRCSADASFRIRVVTVEIVQEVHLPGYGPVTVRGRAAAEFDPMDLLSP